MRQVEFFIKSCEESFEDETTGFIIDEDEFRSSKDFDNFIEWAVDMIKYLHETGEAIKKVIVTDTPVLKEYDV